MKDGSCYFLLKCLQPIGDDSFLFFSTYGWQLLLQSSITETNHPAIASIRLRNLPDSSPHGSALQCVQLHGGGRSVFPHVQFIPLSTCLDKFIHS